MVILYILLAIFLILFFFSLLTVLSTVEIKIINLKVNTIAVNKINDKYKIEISLKLLKRLKWIKLKIDSEKIHRINSTKLVSKIKLKSISDFLNKENNLKDLKKIKLIGNLKFSLKKLKLYICFETESANFTSYITAIVSSIIAILIKKGIDKFEKEKYEYKIIPEYGYKNFLKISLNCIIEIKIVHIINVIYTILKKRSEDKYARTSNRRAYDYSNE